MREPGSEGQKSLLIESDFRTLAQALIHVTTLGARAAMPCVPPLPARTPEGAQCQIQLLAIDPLFAKWCSIAPAMRYA